MKHKSMPIMALAMALMVALGSLGVVYGAWEKQLHASGTVSTATFNVKFANVVWGGNCIGTFTDYQISFPDATNVLPGYQCSATADIVNASSIPVTFTRVEASSGMAGVINVFPTGITVNSTLLPNGVQTALFGYQVDPDMSSGAATNPNPYTVVYNITASQ